jgi:hypothetical protein
MLLHSELLVSSDRISNQTKDAADHVKIPASPSIPRKRNATTSVVKFVETKRDSKSKLSGVFISSSSHFSLSELAQT